MRRMERNPSAPPQFSCRPHFAPRTVQNWEISSAEGARTMPLHSEAPEAHSRFWVIDGRNFDATFQPPGADPLLDPIVGN